MPLPLAVIPWFELPSLSLGPVTIQSFGVLSALGILAALLNSTTLALIALILTGGSTKAFSQATAAPLAVVSDGKRFGTTDPLPVGWQ